MLATLISDLLNLEYLLHNPWWLLLVAFQLWMLVDAVRRQEWFWVLFIVIFPVLNAVLYYFLVYRAAPSATRGFELPGAQDRHRIKELQAQIHHLDKAHLHLQLADLYFHQGKLPRAEASYRAALERDPADPDTQAHLGQCLLRLNRPQEAVPLLEAVAAREPKHDYGHTLMALAETYTALGRTAEARDAWQRVLADHSYARARVQLAELHLAAQAHDAARALLREVVADDAHAPGFQRRKEAVWVKRAKTRLRSLGDA